MEFRTKREAEEKAQGMEQNAASVPATRWPTGETDLSVGDAVHIRRLRAEAARIRALLPTLPE